MGRPPQLPVPTLNYGRMIEGKQGAKEKLNCIVFRQTRCLDQGYKGKTKTIVWTFANSYTLYFVVVLTDKKVAGNVRITVIFTTREISNLFIYI